MKSYNILRKGKSLGVADLLKSCRTSTGYEIMLFKFRNNVMPYLVSVKKGDDTIEFKRLFKGAFVYYLDMVCCYA